MKSWIDRFREANESLTEEEEARHEAEFQALLKSRQDSPDDGRWIDDGPDPFGMNWAWCDGPFDDESAKPEGEILPATAGHIIDYVAPRRPHANVRQIFRYPVLGMAAACLLITLGFLVSNYSLTTSAGPLVASATPLLVPGRGGADSLFVEVHSNLTGFVSVVSLGSGRSPTVRPLPGGNDIPIRPGTPAEIGPLPQDTESVVFAVTEKPASEAILTELNGRPFSPVHSTELASRLEARLKALGFRRAAVGSRPMPATPRVPDER